MANACRRYNYIDELLIDGAVCNDPELIKEKIIFFYQKSLFRDRIMDTAVHFGKLNSPYLGKNKNGYRLGLKNRRFLNV